MGFYQGRALRRDAPRPRRPASRLARLLQVLAAIAVVTVLASLPLPSVLSQLLRVRTIRVEGLRYLDAARVAKIAGVERGRDLLALDPARARQALLLDPRIEAARVAREWPAAVRITIVERAPVLLVRHGLPWEVDSAGVLLPPLSEGVVADVPMLSGVSFDGVAAGSRLAVPSVARGLAWAGALSSNELQLSGQVSEIDVSDSSSTELLLMSGTRVRSPAWPPDTRTLSALRVVLADLAHRGLSAEDVDLRFRNQVIVRPVESGGSAATRVAMDAVGSSAGPVAPANLGSPVPAERRR